MKRITCIPCIVLLLIGFAPALRAQDAAAPFRRTTPPPVEATPTPEPAEMPREEEEPPRRAEPAATPTAERPPELFTPPPAATPEPTAQKPTPAATAKPSRRILQGEPVRAVEPRPPGSRRPRPPESADEPDPTPKPKREKAAEREEKRARSTPPQQPRSQAPSAGALDYWDEDPGSAVKAQERRWQRALVNKDVDTISQLLANDFVATSSTGRTGSKSTVLNAIRRDKNEYKSADARGMSVRMLGPRVAVVTGTATESGTTPDGKSFRNSRRFTDTWMLRNGKWVCVASQATDVDR